MTYMITRIIKHPLFYIVLLAAFLRFYALKSIPPSLNWDETSHGWNAYSLLKTGADEWGVKLPIIFRAFGDYKLPIYIYLTAFSELLFGLNSFAVRLPSVLAGIGTVVVTYFLCLELFNNLKFKTLNPKLIGIIASLLVAIEPWTLFLSRPAFEANVALFFFVSGVFFFLKSIRKHCIYHILLSTVFFGLTVWTYNSYRIFTPLFLGFLVWLYKSELVALWKKNKRLSTYNLLLIAFFFVPMFYQLLNPVGQARYGWVSILDSGAIAQIEDQRRSGCTRFVCNKVTYFTQAFGKNYISHFSGDFLFFKGGSHYQFSIPGYGLLYSVNSILLISGLIYLLWNLVQGKHRELLGRRPWLIILFWFFVSPSASSLTREAPHALRTITMLPVPMILSSIGLLAFISCLKGKKIFYYLLMSSYTIIIAIQFYIYSDIYFKYYPKQFSYAWQYGYKEAVQYIKENYNNYDKIVMTKKYGEPHEFVLFYWSWDPAKYQNDQSLNRFFQTNWYWVDSFDKFFFVNDWEIQDRDREFELESKKIVDCKPESFSCLLVTSPGNVSDGWKKLKTINFLDGRPAFEIYDNR